MFHQNKNRAIWCYATVELANCYSTRELAEVGRSEPVASMFARNGQRSGKDAAKVTERFRRLNYGNLEIEVTVDDVAA